MRTSCRGSISFIGFLCFLVSVAISSTANATFYIDPDPFHTGNDTKFYISGTIDNVSSFFGHVGDQNSGPVVQVVTSNPNTTVDVKNGYSSISPNTNPLASLTFTPTGGVHFGDFSFSLKLDPVGNDNHASQVVNILVNANDGAFSFDFIFDLANADLGPIGVISPDGEWIESVVISTANGFRQVKQIDFSLEATAVPEPSTLLLLGLGLAGIGFLRRRK